MLRSNWFKFGVGLAVGAFFVWLSAKDWDLGRLAGPVSLEGGQLRVGLAAPLEGTLSAAEANALPGWGLDLFWLLPFIAILVAIHVLRVVRWKPLIDPIAPLSLTEHNRIGAVGFMAMFLFPLRLGELVRPFLVKRAVQGVRMTELLASVVVERVVDGLVVSLLLFILITTTTESATRATELEVGAWVALVVFAGATVALVLARWQRGLTRRLVGGTIGLLSKRVADAVLTLLDAFLRGLTSLPNGRALAEFLGMTLLYWALNGLGVYCMILAFHLPVDLAGAYTMMACVVVGMMIPNSPGNAGTFWYFLLLPLPLYGVEMSGPQVAALGLTVWLMQLLQQSLFGLWFVARGNISWARVVEATHDDELEVESHERRPEALEEAGR